MGYVMVPVPEEYVEEVMQAVLRLSAQARTEPWDAESLSSLFNELDEAAKAVLSAVARGTLSTGTIEDNEVANLIELSNREVLGILREINEAAVKSSRPSVVFNRMDPEVLPNGRTREKRVLWMNNDVALVVREAEREELSAAPHRLMSDDG